MSMRFWLPLPLLLCFATPGCTTQEVISANSTPARQATVPVPADELLDIGILPLDPGIPPDPEVVEKNLIVPDVRQAESSYLAYHLKDTLELTGNWGAVRVTPASSRAVDLELSGQILLSDGERIEVRVKAVDARNRVWFEKSYEDIASRLSYEQFLEDPFQDLYNDIADDLLNAREAMSRERIIAIKRIANIRYASDLAPEAFQDYLREPGRGEIKLVQLPAENDSMMRRIDRIKEQEYLFVDTLDEYYSRFYKDMQPSYNEWRHATYTEALRLRDLQRQARKNFLAGALLVAGGLAIANESNTRAGQASGVGAVSGGIGNIRAGMSRMRQVETQAEALKELSQSLGAEVTPYVLDIEGRTIELTGSAEEQYAQWRELLSDIYARETSLPAQ